jgi:hypothetical protein
MNSKILIACASLALGAVAMFAAEPTKAQTVVTPGATFVTNENAPAVRAAYSTVSIGGAAHSIALEVVYPKGTIANGDFILNLDWTGPVATDDPNNALLDTATLTVTSTTQSGIEQAVSAAVTDAWGVQDYAAVGMMTEKLVGPNGFAGLD